MKPLSDFVLPVLALLAISSVSARTPGDGAPVEPPARKILPPGLHVYYVEQSVPVTLQFTITKQVPGTFLHDAKGNEDKAYPAVEDDWITTKNGSVAKHDAIFAMDTKTQKYGNKEFIADLVAAGVLTGPVTGWKLLSTPNITGGEAEQSIFASKEGEYDVLLSDNLSIGHAFYLAARAQHSTVYAADGATITSIKTSGTLDFKSPVTLKFAIPTQGSPVDLSGPGVFTGSGKIFSYLTNPNDVSSEDNLAVPGSFQFTNFISTYLDESGDGPYLWSIEGSLFFGASKALRQEYYSWP